MEAVYKKSDLILAPYGYCPGCLHGVIAKTLTEVIDEMGIRDKCVAVCGVGCTAMGITVANFDSISSLHGRAAAVATGISRVNPELCVFTFQGVGDCASIGTNETLHAANRGENFTAIMCCNTVYGMTGAQMAPTTLVGQKTITCPDGRDPAVTGYPIHMAELIAQLEAPRYVARVAAHRPKYILQMKKILKKALEVNLNGGYSFVEIVSGCPTGIKTTPDKMPDYIDKYVLAEYPLGVFKDTTEQ